MRIDEFLLSLLFLLTLVSGPFAVIVESKSPLIMYFHCYMSMHM